MDCKYPDCELKGYAFDLEPRTGKPITCFNNCPTMRKHELTADMVENPKPTTRTFRYNPLQGVSVEKQDDT